MKNKMLTVFSILMVFASTEVIAQGTNDVYSNGTVWDVTMINIEADVKSEFLTILNNTWAFTMREAQKEELILSYKILMGDASSEKDFNIILMVENEKLGDYDPDPVRDAKWNLIKQKMISNYGEEKYERTVKRNKQIRHLLSEKTMRQIHLIEK